MHRHQCPGGRGDRRLQLIEINQIAGGVHIHKHRPCPHGTDRFCGGKKTKRTGDHLIAWAHPQGPQGQHEGIGAAVAADGMGYAAEFGKGRFEIGNQLAADVLAAAQHRQHRLIKLFPQLGKLHAEVERGYRHGAQLTPFTNATGQSQPWARANQASRSAKICGKHFLGNPHGHQGQ